MLPPRILRVLFLTHSILFAVAASAEEDKTSETCGVCHEKETAQWQASPHARTMDDAFLAVWQRHNQKWECLVCHTSKADRKTGKFSHDGVSCESCHGAPNADHPDKTKMSLPTSSEVCQGCHTVTYGEWRVSAHGSKDKKVHCFHCHKMHQMDLRKDKPDDMCGSCHTERLKDFSHATHAVEGLHCLSCHMPEIKGSVAKIRGLGVRGHTFGVGAETCANCHREMVHASHEKATLNEEVRRLKTLTPEKLTARVTELEKKTTQLQDNLSANRRVFIPLVGMSFLLGIFAGYALPHLRKPKPGSKP